MVLYVFLVMDSWANCEPSSRHHHHHLNCALAKYRELYAATSHEQQISLPKDAETTCDGDDDDDDDIVSEKPQLTHTLTFNVF